MSDTLYRKLTDLLNKESGENDSNTPDFILAQFMLNCLHAFNQATQQRETWYGRDARPTLHGKGKEDEFGLVELHKEDCVKLKPDPLEKWLDDMPSGPNYFDNDAQWRDQMLDWFRKMPRGK